MTIIGTDQNYPSTDSTYYRIRNSANTAAISFDLSDATVPVSEMLPASVVANEWVELKGPSSTVYADAGNPVAIPEPTSIALLAAGLLGFGVSRKKATQA